MLNFYLFIIHFQFVNNYGHIAYLYLRIIVDGCLIIRLRDVYLCEIGMLISYGADDCVVGCGFIYDLTS